jgi:ankyrin repeat protein
MKAFFRRFPILLLVILVWSIPASCGEIHEAAGSGNIEKVEALLKDNPKLVSSKDREERTALHWAANYGKKAVAELLLAKGANVNAKSWHGLTPLHYAVTNGHKTTVELLLAKGANVNVKSNDGYTPFHLAVDGDFKDIIELLRQHGGHP